MQRLVKYIFFMDAANPDKLLARVDNETAFVLGNGPSLASVSLPALSDYATVGLNAAYRFWREIDWRPRYYACLDLVVGLSHKDAIAELIDEGSVERFLLRNNLIEALGAAAHNPRVVNFDVLSAREPLLSLPSPTTGSHSALWAASMGYKTIVMLGVDVQYKEVVAGAERRDGIELEIVEDRDNPNYFFSGYQAPGDRYNLPNPRPDLHVNAWRQAGAHMAKAGVRVFNANKASAVQCFSFINLEDFLAGGSRPDTAGEPLEEQREETMPTPQTVRRRVRAFASAYAGKAIGLGVATALGLLVWASVAEPSLASLAGVGVAALAAGGGLIILAYIRFAILAHLQRQDEELTALRARISELERSATSNGVILP